MSALLDTLLQGKAPGKLIRLRGAQLSEAFCVLGGTERFSAKDVREAIAAGDLVADGEYVQVAPSVLEGLRKAARSKSAKKAAETRRNAPLSRSGRMALELLSQTRQFVRPRNDREYEGMRDCLRKGFAMRGTFGSGWNGYHAFVITPRGLNELGRAA